MAKAAGGEEKLLLKKLHSAEGKLAQAITDWAGSMRFAYLHVVWFGSWIAINHGALAPVVPVFDPFPYGLLTMVVSLEAIFLSTFIMVAQNRQELVDEYRELEEEKEEQEADQEVEEMQQDLDDIKQAVSLIQDKLVNLDKISKGNGRNG